MISQEQREQRLQRLRRKRRNAILGRIFYYLLMVGLIVYKDTRTSNDASTPKAAQNYNPHLICEDAFEEKEDHRKERVTNFIVTMREGCFGGFVLIPEIWHQWAIQPSGGEKDWWIAFWFEGEPRGTAAFRANDKYNFPNKLPARIQGQGRARFYTEDFIPSQ
jgi:hypothetical protein